jgi:ADP-ribosyl-[dinitrogen reductase] hydrolase
VTPRDRIIAAIIGTLVGDALGVPAEFSGRSMRDLDPVTGMRGHGTWDQPAGTWSDDGAMTLVAAQSLLDHGWDLQAMMAGFLRWFDECWWTPHGEVFDIGNRTRNSLSLFRIDRDIANCGGDDDADNDNDNGSLMRCMPISLWLRHADDTTLITRAGEASALTHAHIRSKLCCAWHALWCRALLAGKNVRQSAASASRILACAMPAAESGVLKRIIDGSAMDLDRRTVVSGGYVVSTLEASLWCVAQHDDFASATLAAVNLGGDTDTTAAVTGGMAGLLYGLDAIPRAWIDSLARRDDVLDLAERFADACLAAWAKPITR